MNNLHVYKSRKVNDLFEILPSMQENEWKRIVFPKEKPIENHLSRLNDSK